jgi:hypothetical protein
MANPPWPEAMTRASKRRWFQFDRHRIGRTVAALGAFLGLLFYLRVLGLKLLPEILCIPVLFVYPAMILLGCWLMRRPADNDETTCTRT